LIAPRRWPVLCALVLAVVGCAGGAENRLVDDEDVAALAEASCPQPLGLTFGPPDAKELQRAMRGHLEVFGTPVVLRPPVDWSEDPLEAGRYRQNLFKLRFLDPLIAAYIREGDLQALRHALALVLDFAGQEPFRGSGTIGEAWTDKVVGDRAPLVGFVMRAAGCEGLLNDEDARTLAELGAQHGAFLEDESRYEPDNHGLFADRGLYLIAAYLPFLGESEAWKELARERFEETLRGRLSEGMWLEHSSGYQFLAIRPLEDFIKLLDGDRELEGVMRRMRASAAWMVEPDGLISQFGDSNLDAPPAWALRKAERLHGVRGFFGAGYGFVRAKSGQGDGYLAVTAGFHNLTHKHADELSFELYDGGHRIVTDTGLFHKDPGVERDFVLSPQAHSTLTVDDAEWPIDDNERDYGAALKAVGEGDGWYGIFARNPLVRPQGVEHTRLFLYKPGEALVIVDRARSDEDHRYTRYLQMGPDLRLARESDPAEFRTDGLEVDVTDSSQSSRMSTYRGREDPPGGLTSPGFREFLPRRTLAFKTTERDADHALTLSLDGRPRSVSLQKRGDETVVVLRGGRSPERLSVERHGRHLSIGSVTSQASGVSTR
jgi:hypothetical protein